MLKRWIVTLALLAAGATAALAERPAALDTPEITRRAERLRPAPEELKWQRIPWAPSLVEAQRLARAERRPVFLWILDDEPFDRC
jgi:hypothetical protein